MAIRSLERVLTDPHATEALLRTGLRAEELKTLEKTQPTRIQHKLNLIEQEIKLIQQEQDRAKKAAQNSEIVMRAPAATKKHARSASRHALERASLELTRKIEQEVIRKKSEQKLADAEAARAKLVRERDKKLAADSARRAELRRLKCAQIEAQRSSQRPASAPAQELARERVQRTENKELAIQIASVQSKKEELTRRREASLRERIKERERKAVEMQKKRKVDEEEAARRRLLLSKQFELRRELHSIISESANYDLLSKAQQASRNAESERRRRQDEMVRKSQLEQKKKQDAVRERRAAVQAAAQAAAISDARRIEKRSISYSAAEEEKSTQRQRQRSDASARSRMRVQTRRISDEIDRKMLAKKIEQDLERAAQLRASALTDSASFDRIRRRRAIEDNMRAHRRREEYRVERTKRSIAEKNERYDELKRKAMKEKELKQFERARQLALEDQMRSELESKARALIAAAPASHSKRALPPDVPRRPYTAPVSRRQSQKLQAETEVESHSAVRRAEARRVAAQKRGRVALAIARATSQGDGALAAIERLRRRQNEELLAMATSEQVRENERALLLEQAQGADRERLEKILNLERRNAEETALKLTTQHELELTQEMSRLGVCD